MASDSSLVARLRGSLAQVRAAASPFPAVSLGARDVDSALGGGLKRDGVHEFFAASPGDSPAALAMTLLVALRSRGEGAAPILWLRERRARGNGDALARCVGQSPHQAIGLGVLDVESHGGSLPFEEERMMARKIEPGDPRFYFSVDSRFHQ